MPFPICKGNQKHVSRLILRGKNYQRIKEHIKKKIQTFIYRSEIAG